MRRSFHISNCVKKPKIFFPFFYHASHMSVVERLCPMAARPRERTGNHDPGTWRGIEQPRKVLLDQKNCATFKLNKILSSLSTVVILVSSLMKHFRILRWNQSIVNIVSVTSLRELSAKRRYVSIRVRKMCIENSPEPLPNFMQ